MNELTDNLAFVFPGQGSQSLGMLSELGSSRVEVKQTFEEASQSAGIDLWRLSQEGPEDQLNLTINTQPLMLAAGVAVWRVWCNETDIRPSWMAGHSLGEYTALVCSNAMSFEGAVGLVAERARLMQEAVKPGVGAMAAILGMDAPEVVKLCLEISGDRIVAPVNFNAPGQIVVAGHAGAVEQLLAAAKDHGAKRAVILPVSVPSHCELMEQAAEQLGIILEEITIETPKISVIHNFDVASHAAPEVIRNVLKKQLCNPVRWVESVKFMHEQGVGILVECGPGKVLSGLNKRIVRGCKTAPIFDSKSLDQALVLIQ